MTVINRIASHLSFKENGVSTAATAIACNCKRQPHKQFSNAELLSVRLEACKCNLVNVIMDC